MATPSKPTKPFKPSKPSKPSKPMLNASGVTRAEDLIKLERKSLADF